MMDHDATLTDPLARLLRFRPGAHRDRPVGEGAGTIDPKRCDFRTVFDRYRRTLDRYFVRRGFSPEDAEELTQETFLGIYKGMESFRSEAGFDTWVFRVATNVWRQTLRHRHATKRRGLEISLSVKGTEDSAEVQKPSGQSLDPAAEALVRERVTALRDAVAGLPRRMRQCVLLRLRQELTYPEIARVLNLSPQTVKVQLFRARKRLQEHQIEHFGDLDF